MNLRRRYGRAGDVKRKLTAELPDGFVVSRTTTHAYTHVITSERGGKWGVWGWTTQPMKMLDQARRRTTEPVRAVPVTSSMEIKAGKKRVMPGTIEYHGFHLVPVRRQPGFSIRVDRGARFFFEDYSKLPIEEAFTSAKAKIDKYLEDAAFLRSRGWTSSDDYEWHKPGVGRDTELLTRALYLERGGGYPL